MGGSWSRDEQYQFWINVRLPLNYIALFVNFIALVAFYAFKNQRKFPTSVLAWICLLDFGFNLEMVIKWTPNTVIHKLWALGPTSHWLCRFGTVLDSFFICTLVICNTLVIATLYISIVKRKEMDYNVNPKYYWIFMAIVWVWGLFFGLVTLGFDPATSATPYCTMNKWPIAVTFSAIAIAFFVQMVLLILTLRYMHRILEWAKSVSDTASKDRRKAWIYIRFLAVFFIQWLALPAGTSLWLVGWAQQMPKASHLAANGVLLPIGMTLDGLILISGNRALQKWFKEKLLRMQVSSSSGTTDNSVALSTANKNSSGSSANTTASVNLSVSV